VQRSRRFPRRSSTFWPTTQIPRCETLHVWRHLYLKCIILPRQARDNHWESSTQKRDGAFLLYRSKGASERSSMTPRSSIILWSGRASRALSVRKSHLFVLSCLVLSCLVLHRGLSRCGKATCSACLSYLMFSFLFVMFTIPCAGAYILYIY
jgi:hypothetical protein